MANSKGQIAVWILAALLVLLILWQPSWGFKAGRALLWLIPGDAGSETGGLLMENQALKAEIAGLKEVQGILRATSRRGLDLIPASVYSRYPLNFKNELLVGAGENAGVKTGQAAVLGAAASVPDSPSRLVILGKVEKVFLENSVIQTVFDPRFQLAVRVGGKGVEALLQGGSEPRITLIPKDAEVLPGDVIYASDASFAYGLTVAEAGEVRLSPEGLFQEASLRFAYDINRLRAVLIVKN